MTSTLVYTFRTSKYLEEFRKAGMKVFVFGKLKEGIINFQQLVDKTNPRQIIGVAETRTQSRFEALAINTFGRNGTVNKMGRESYALNIPSNTDFPKSKKPTHSFCNWTMYKISELVDSKHVKVSFLHFNREDFPKVLSALKNDLL